MDPLSGGFWFVMSAALIVGFAFAYPVNWWLVARGLKHGMITSPPSEGARTYEGEPTMGGSTSGVAQAAMALLTIAILALSITLTQSLPM